MPRLVLLEDAEDMVEMLVRTDQAVERLWCDDVRAEAESSINEGFAGSSF
jgi:hypothetical protein